MIRAFHTLEFLGHLDNLEVGKELQTAFEKLQGDISDQDLSDFLAQILEVIHHAPAIARFTKKSFTTPKLVIFDLDSTLVQSEYMVSIGMREEALEQRSVLMRLTQAALNGEGTWVSNFTQRVKLLRGMEVERLKKYYQELTLSEGARELMAMLKSYQIPTAIISGAWIEYVRYIAECLQTEEHIGSVWKHTDGILTGEIEGEPIGPQAKARVMDELADKYGITPDEIVVIADGYNDLPMMAKAGCSFMIFTTQKPSPSLVPIMVSLEVDLMTI